jgi:hypothetical protein
MKRYNIERGAKPKIHFWKLSLYRCDLDLNGLGQVQVRASMLLNFWIVLCLVIMLLFSILNKNYLTKVCIEKHNTHY